MYRLFRPPPLSMTQHCACVCPNTRINSISCHCCYVWPSLELHLSRPASQTESTLADNRAVYQKIRILPRLMRDVSQIDMTCRLLGEHNWMLHCASCVPRLQCMLIQRCLQARTNP